jgi:uncharacterized protein YraI
MPRYCTHILGGLLLLLLAGTVAAMPMTVRGATQLHAGPSVEYPPIAPLAGGSLVEVYGCVEGYAWCDVQYGAYRGWVFGPTLYASYRGRPRPLLAVGATLGVGIVAFSVADYWNRFYVGRPWYRRYYGRWAGRPVPGYWPPGYVRREPR